MRFSTRLMSATALLCVFACNEECPSGLMMGLEVCKVPEAGKPASVAGSGGRGGTFSWPRFDDAGAGRGGGGAGGSGGSPVVEEDAGTDAAMSMAKTCGNGLLDPGEACDFDCPTDCDTGNKCLVGRLEGSADECSATCKQERVTACENGDGCCADGCSAENDDDCSATCGNGTVEEQETCDGECPGSCDDGDACTVDMQTGTADQCSIVCMHEPARANRTPDGCCPAGANVSTDPDCPQRCGDGVVSGNETCDPMSNRKCPASCDDRNACTRDGAEGTAEACTLRCTHEPIPEGGACGTGLRCDAEGECGAPMCGDGTLDDGELCDGDCPTSCPQPTGAENECRANVLWTRDGACRAECRAGVKSAGIVCADGRGACNGAGAACIRNIWYRNCASAETHCMGALQCREGRNVCSARCDTADDCGVGGVCFQGWCDKTCETSADCTEAQTCVEWSNYGWYCRPNECSGPSSACGPGFRCTEAPTTAGNGTTSWKCLPAS